MRYMGSKNRLMKKGLREVIQSYADQHETYIEPFVGGANVIDKIEHSNKIGYDSNEYLIALLNHAKDNIIPLDLDLSHKKYKDVKQSYSEKDGLYSDWEYGLYGFCCAFGSKFFSGYAHVGVENLHRNIPLESIINLQKQVPNIKEITFLHANYSDINPNEHTNTCFYLDPPYRNTTKYKDSIDYDHFYNWCRELAKNGNTVLISEYEMPSDFKCIWEYDLTNNTINNNNKYKARKAIREKLFLIKI